MALEGLNSPKLYIDYTILLSLGWVIIAVVYLEGKKRLRKRPDEWVRLKHNFGKLSFIYGSVYILILIYTIWILFFRN